MTGLIDKLFARRKAAEAASVNDYKSLVEQIAGGGKEPTPDAAERILQASGRNPEQLAEDVALLQQRRAWAATLAEEPAILERLAPIDGQLQAERDRFSSELRKLQEGHRAAVAALTARQAELLGRQNVVASARIRLQETSFRFAEYLSVCSQYGSVHEKLTTIPAEIRRAGSPRLAARLTEELEAAQDFADQVRGQAAAIEAELIQP